MHNLEAIIINRICGDVAWDVGSKTMVNVVKNLFAMLARKAGLCSPLMRDLERDGVEGRPWE